MYRHIKRSDLSTCEKDFLGQQVFITSSFYGIIPAFTLFKNIVMTSIRR